MTRLRIAPGLALPIEAATQTLLIVGKRGSGKSSTATRVAEQLIGAKVPIAVLDPVDVWHGLRAGADGGRAGGLDVYVFGGAHADVPLETLGVEATRETVAGWLGVHPRGGSVGEELKALADAGLISYERGRIGMSAAGREAAGELPPEAAIARASSGLTNRQRRIFDIVVEVHPEAIARDAIAERMGIHPRGGSFGEDLSRLRGRGLVEYERGLVRARDFLFAGAGA